MAAALSLAVLGLSGCAQSGAKTSAEASAENPMVLTLAHGLSETHTVLHLRRPFLLHQEQGNPHAG